jgi:hypothetical protein
LYDSVQLQRRVVFVPRDEVATNCVAQSRLVACEFVDAVCVATDVGDWVELVLDKNFVAAVVASVLLRAVKVMYGELVNDAECSSLVARPDSATR